MHMMEGERGIVLEGMKRGAGHVEYRSAGIGVEDETIVDFGLEWMDKLADEPVDDMEDDDEEIVGMEDDAIDDNEVEGAGMEEDMEDPVQDLSEMFGLGEFMDLIITFLAGEIRDSS
eukprot:TRINITY_DN23396_c0_g1_i1.p2 TRINITY_DN23396_c0_g1~~TRINITY_DN23396_c0_g1_i1.p2  ORF type:complete len:117 (-),score=51.69 TRINITY_DN23396_c0_g1_i1:113-463(-)